MIGFLRGKLVARQPPALVVDVGGVGYECEAPLSTFYNLPGTGHDVALFTHLVVREDAHMLYAFGSDQERRVFRSLLKVSGVGPKMALGILSGISIDAFVLCVEAQDPNPLVRIPGVGRKTAERLLIDLRDRLKDLATGSDATTSLAMPQATAAQGEAYSALVALGYKPAEVVKLLKAVSIEGASTEDLIRRALQSLGS